jgi:hypothetical protein
MVVTVFAFIIVVISFDGLPTMTTNISVCETDFRIISKTNQWAKSITAISELDVFISLTKQQVIFYPIYPKSFLSIPKTKSHQTLFLR